MTNKQQEYVSKLTGEILPFQTKYSYVNDKSEKNDKPSDTDATLFVPLKTMINKIVRGDISEIANAYFDDEHEDPTDAPGYDIADAFEDLQKCKDELNAQSEQKAEKSADATALSPESTKVDSELNERDSSSAK